MSCALSCANRIVIAVAVLWAASAQASQSPATSVVLGRVVEGVSEVPIADAMVLFVGMAAPYVRVGAMTDSNGSFTFFNVPAGQYELSATKPGYWSGGFGQRRPNGQGRSYVVTNDHRDGAARVPLWKFATVSGTIVDEAGEPVVGIGVQALTVEPSGAQRFIFNNSAEAYRTDDRGMYRISNLLPGEYLFSVPASEIASAAPRPGKASGLSYSPAFFPSGVKPGMDSLLSLASGEERVGVDFRLQLVQSYHVAGRVVGGSSPRDVLVQLKRASDAFLTEPVVAEALTGPDGSFRFNSVVPGEYVVKVFQPSKSPADAQGGGAALITRNPVTPPIRQRQELVGWRGATPVVVSDSDIHDVSVDLQSPNRISGDVIFNGTAIKPRAQEVALMLSPTLLTGRWPEGPDGSHRLTQVDDKFHFQTMELSPGQYFLRGGPSVLSSWAIESINLGDRDALDTPITVRDQDVRGLVVTFTDKLSEVNGTVRKATGDADLDATVIVFPADRALRSNYGRDSPRLRIARVGIDGRFSVKGLPSGEYLAAALDDATAGRWRTSAILERVSRDAEKFTVAAGSKQSIDLKVISIR